MNSAKLKKAGERCAVEPSFLDTPGGRVFVVHHRPPAARGHVLCVPPFNEEMNRCRSMITLQARAFAQAGLGTLVVDLAGTGDSEGEHADARWERWQSNLGDAMRWLAQREGCVAIWGIRLGAILAAELHAAQADPKLPLLLWQPVADGKTHLTQFMRVKIAAQMDRPDLPKLTTAAMREAWGRGESVEIAGYEIHPELARAIDAARLEAHPVAAGTRVCWLENVGAADTEPTPATRNLLSRWPGEHADLTTSLFTGPAFWQLHERVLAPQAIQRTMAWLQGDGSRAG